MSQPTPGPWRLSDGWAPTLSVVDTQNVYGKPPAGVVAHVVMASQDGLYTEERKANARLIAQAPAMREALQELLMEIGLRMSAGEQVLPHAPSLVKARALLKAIER